MENKTSKNILLTIMGVLILAEIVARISIFQTNPFSGCLIFISLIFVALYGFSLYKKPHGNLLKYAMLIFAIANIISATAWLMISPDYSEVVRILACAAVCYGAGRLNRIEQNKILFPIISVIFLIKSIILLVNNPVSNVFNIVAYFNPLITFTTLMIAYFVRYKEHKEAGVMDAPKA